jgi:hypothetical protein
MQNAPTEPQSWDNYIQTRFVRYYQQFLSTIDTLVVAFDNYQYVPLAKSMTQVLKHCYTLFCMLAKHPKNTAQAPPEHRQHPVQRDVAAAVHGPGRRELDAAHEQPRVQDEGW